MQRFLIKDQKIGLREFILYDNEIVFQLIKVLRSKVGDNVIFFNGEEEVDYVYELKNISKRELKFEFVESIDKIGENEFNINLYQALPNKISKLEYIVQKGVESGISAFIFFRSERSQKLILSNNKIERLKKIIIESIEQSGRNIVPKIKILDNSLIELLHGLQSLSMMSYMGSDHEKNLYFHTKNDNSKSLKKINLDSNINLFVGPEGGWSNEEVLELRKIGFTQIYLGARILRCETVSSVVAFYLGL